MLRVVGDLEANGLLQIKWNKKGEVDSLPATKIWCGVFKDLDTLEVYKFLPDQLEEMCNFLDAVTYFAIHNGADYDIPLLKSILDYTYTGELFDTFIVSQLTCPDRIGGHGLEAWGERFGVPKPKHEDWSKFSPEMMYRCEQDVEINYLTYLQLLKELG